MSAWSEQRLSKRYPNLDDTRRDIMRRAWRSYEDVKVWKENELKQAYWQRLPPAEREKKLMAALTTNVELKAGPRYSDASIRNAASGYLRFERLQRTFNVIEMRALIDQATTEAQFEQITDDKGRRTAAIDTPRTREPERMRAYLTELGAVRTEGGAAQELETAVCLQS
jgi:hypothetical protein